MANIIIKVICIPVTLIILYKYIRIIYYTNNNNNTNNKIYLQS